MFSTEWQKSISGDTKYFEKAIDWYISHKKTPWKAKSNEIYFTPLITSAHKYTKQRIAADIDNILYIDIDDILYNRGLMCKTSEQAEELSKLLIKTARKFQGFDEDEKDEKDEE